MDVLESAFIVLMICQIATNLVLLWAHYRQKPADPKFYRFDEPPKAKGILTKSGRYYTIEKKRKIKVHSDDVAALKEREERDK